MRGRVRLGVWVGVEKKWGCRGNCNCQSVGAWLSEEGEGGVMFV